MRAAVLTISTSLSAGDGEDRSGPELVRRCEEAGFEVKHETLPDDRAAIVEALDRLADRESLRFVFTTGGTGMTPDDVTPRPRSTPSIAWRRDTPRRSGPSRGPTRRSASSRAGCQACAGAR